MLAYKFHPEARIELSAELAYYDENDAQSARSFFLEISQLINLIRENSSLFRLKSDHHRANLKRFPFYLPFILREDTVIILAIAPSTRKPRYWEQRLFDQ